MRTLPEIIAHIRAVVEDPSISATLIQTEDLLALCDAAERTASVRTEAVLGQYHTNPELLRLIAESKERVAKMTPNELEVMYQKQRESWLRQDLD